MLDLKEIKKKIEKRKITFYEVQFSTDTLKSGIKFNDINSFIEFVDKQKIDVVFGDIYYDNPNDYIITEDMIQKNIIRYLEFDIMDIIQKDIEKHNKEVMNTDFNNPSAIVLVSIYNGQLCYVYIEDEENILIEAKEKLQEILDENSSNIQHRETENNKIVKKLKEELKERIVNDDKFWLCTNKHLRYVYIRDMVKNKLGKDFEPLKASWESDAPIGVYTDATDFVEMIWREKKNK